MNVSDNELLRQYKIDVHPNFDCHAHAKLETADWSVSEVVELSGTSAQISRSILIPDSATAGTYHLSIQVADHFGNSVKTEIYSSFGFQQKRYRCPSFNGHSAKHA
jgi:hypothetical protein